MVTAQDILAKLTTRNTIALAVTGMFLFVIWQMTTNVQAMLIIIEENAELVISGSIVFGVLLAKWSDIIQFYFRASGKKPTEPVTENGTGTQD